MIRRIDRRWFYTLGMLCLIACLSVPGVSAKEASQDGAEATAKELPRYTLIYGGDLFCARRLNFALLSQDKEAKNEVLDEIAPLFREADMAMVNLEGMVSTGGYYNRIRNCSYAYRAFPNVVDMLKDAGVDLVTIGNNHNGDYGPEAQLETIDHLAKAGIQYVGAGANIEEAMRPVYCQFGDVVVAIINMETSDAEVYKAEKDRPGLFFHHRVAKDAEKDQVLVDLLAKEVKKARRHAHLVFFSPHGANRGKDTYVTPLRHELAVKLIRESGFDAILGHGAHHPEAVEVVDGKPVIHDAGNLVLDFDPVKKPHLDTQTRGMLWKIEFSKAGVHHLEGIPLYLGFLKTHIATGKRREMVLDHVVGTSQEFNTPLRVDEGHILIDVDPGEVLEPTVEPKALKRPVHSTVRRAPTDVLHERLPKGVTPIDVRYANGIRLVGYELVSPVLRAEKKSMSEVVVLYWETDRPIKENYVIHLEARPVDDGKLRGNVVIRKEPHLPGDWLFPTYMWPVGKVIQDTQNFRMCFGSKPLSDEMAFFVGLRNFGNGRGSTFLTPVEANGVKLFKKNLIPLGTRPISEDATKPREVHKKWRENRKIELSPKQPFDAPPLNWPPKYGGD